MPPKKRNSVRKKSTASAEPEGVSMTSALSNLDILAVCRGDIPLPEGIKYHQIVILLGKVKLTDKLIETTLLHHVLKFTDISARNILSRALIS